MLAQQRHRHITKALQSAASVSTMDLARALRVSPETIRRDLIQLEQDGLLRRVYGGAVTLTRQRGSEPSFEERAVIHAEAKRTVGELAADLVADGQTVFIDVGTTAHAAARALALTFRGTVVSHSLLVATEVAKGPEADLLLAPGRLRRGEWSLSGTATHRFIQAMHFDVALLSCGGVDASVGATDFDFDDVEIKRTVARNSERSYILADSSKHGVVGRYAIGDWYDVNGLVTDLAPPDGLHNAIRAAGGAVRAPVR
ncbi:DeoR/GlpR transcriptional regulator [Georgenia sp. 311]|uniref:Lactose phosphotransferase system repressor n=1 Tax=Georgenia wutianyii TaxID=2585135 RepID=A0ABX5VPN0_9MICO|nr:MULTISPECIES: DeoR/GlpR family DNA-binding transcription regulator [Georgenia]QDB79631.1 DeoR/GlpR transcriptional regulator [Georgenia wutianyii]TNC20780.1 DeoR/GlpR transcriptional regulator [Georgenia sp. 311]